MMIIGSSVKTLAAMATGILLGLAFAGRPQVRAQAPPAASADHPLAPEIVDAEHYKVEIDNQYVRVIRCKIPVHDRVKLHHHPAGSVVVLLEDQTDGTVREVHNKAKRVSWGMPSTHMGENIGDQLYEYVRVDVKAAK